MPFKKLIIMELRRRMHTRESPFGRYIRLCELAKHKSRIQHMKNTIITSGVVQRFHDRKCKQRPNPTQALLKAAKWSGKYQPPSKDDRKAHSWSEVKIGKGDPAPFSTLKIQPRNDRMHDIDKSVQAHRKRIQRISQTRSPYRPLKQTSLSRGEAEWYHESTLGKTHTIDDKLKVMKQKWAMRHNPKPVPPVDAGIMAYLPPFFSVEEPKAEPVPLSHITKEDIEKSPELAQVKDVQNAGNPNF